MHFLPGSGQWAAHPGREGRNLASDSANPGSRAEPVQCRGGGVVAAGGNVAESTSGRSTARPMS
jgi:hypothetical protein